MCLIAVKCFYVFSKQAVSSSHFKTANDLGKIFDSNIFYSLLLTLKMYLFTRIKTRLFSVFRFLKFQSNFVIKVSVVFPPPPPTTAHPWYTFLCIVIVTVSTNLQPYIYIFLQVHIKSSFIMNGVCIIYKGWTDLQRLDGLGYLEFDEDKAKVNGMCMLLFLHWSFKQPIVC